MSNIVYFNYKIFFLTSGNTITVFFGGEMPLVLYLFLNINIIQRNSHITFTRDPWVFFFAVAQQKGLLGVPGFNPGPAFQLCTVFYVCICCSWWQAG
jgi:hypothetical protein